MIEIKQRPYLYNWTGNSVYYQLYSAAAAADPTIFFEVRVFFKFANGTDYTEIITLPLTPVNGSVKFNIQDVLHAHLKFNFPDLHPGETIVEVAEQSGAFYIDFREISAAAPDPAWDSSEVAYFRQILKGGIHAFQFKGNNYWLNYHPDNKPFLTWQPSGKLATYKERMYLAWYCQQQVLPPNMIVRVIVTFADTTTATKEFVIPNTQHHVYYIPTGAAQLNLQLLGLGKRIWYWTVQVLDITTPLTPVAASQIYQYYLDNRNDYNGITLHYRNSLGGIDSVRVRGVIDTSLQHTLTETSGLLESDYFMKDQLPALNSVLKAKETVSFRGDIGHLSKEEQDRLRDAFLNRQCFQERNGKWWPVKLTNTNTKLRSTNDKRWSMPIEWQWADGGSYFYTPDVNLGDGYDSDNVCDCAITGLAVVVTFGAGNTIAYGTFTFGVFCPDGENIDTVQYRVNGGDWVDIPYPYITPPQFSFGVNQFYTADWRVKCPSGEFGPLNTIAVNTNLPGVEPEPDPEPEPEAPPIITIKLYNNLMFSQTFTVLINNTIVKLATVPAGAILTFYQFGTLTDANFEVRTNSVTPSGARLVSESIETIGSIGPMRAFWSFIDVPEIAEIYIQ